jgi:hypothetical protein
MSDEESKPVFKSFERDQIIFSDRILLTLKLTKFCATQYDFLHDE